VTKDDDASSTPVGEASSAGPASSGSTAKRPARRRRLPGWAEFLLVLLVALVAAIGVKAYVVEAFYIPSVSMQPGLQEDDRILVQKWSYLTGEPQRGDVVVFEDPGGWLNDGEVEEPGALSGIGLGTSGGHLVKRVVGVPGDVIECCDSEGRLVINGVAVTEDVYVVDDQRLKGCRGPMTGNCEWSAGPVPEGSVFVMGDNRGESADSTVHMCLPQETDCVPGDEYVPFDLVTGKVFYLFWPRDHATGIADAGDVFDDVPDESDNAPAEPPATNTASGAATGKDAG